MAQRIKGQEVEVIVIVDGAPQRTINTVRSFEMTWLLDTLTEEYLGETTKRTDSVFSGISGKIELHVENADVFKLLQKIIDKARRRTAGTSINIKATLKFPNGDRPRVVVPDVDFGEFPLGFGGRSEYGTVSLNFVASEASIS